jgi:hypothetical protein
LFSVKKLFQKTKIFDSSRGGWLSGYCRCVPPS